MPSILETLQKLRSFEELQDGWSVRGGLAPNRTALDKAFRYVYCASSYGITRANAFVGDEGEVALLFYDGNRTLEFVLESDETITLAEEVNDEQVDFIENLPDTEVWLKLSTFPYPGRHYLGSLIRSTTIQRSVASQASLLTRPATAESLRSTSPVLRLPRGVSVSTSTRSTKAKQDIQDSIGLYPMGLCQIAA